MTLVDSNVLIDVLSADPLWLQWSLHQLARARAAGALNINIVIYAELCAHPPLSARQVDAFLTELNLELREISRDSAYAAAQAFVTYRRNRGSKTSVLPDFFIGGQAVSENLTLLTRDSARYKTYFPTIKLICP